MNFIYLTLIIVVGFRADLIEISDGVLEGMTMVAKNGRIFKGYQGIPYAKPTSGKLRFQPPVPVEKWDGIFNATGTPPTCPQILELTTTYSGSEDCLYVNVYTPQNAKPGSNIPVIFYIFGGIFIFGHPLKFGPEYMLGRNIILVMVNYRVDVLGFLSTGDLVVPGNMGLKDQALAMKWTKNNIDKFGGDPNRITLQGHSSGAMCVHLHTFSPLSAGYFNRVIMQSGLGTSPQAFNDKDIAKGMTIALARSVNCTFKTSEKILQCLQSKDAESLIRMAKTINVWQTVPQAVFKPTFEDKNVKNAFLTEVPVVASYLSTNINWLFGMTSGEAAAFVSNYYKYPEILQDLTTFNYTLTLPLITNFLWTSKPAHIDYIVQAIQSYFLGGKGIALATEQDLADMLTGAQYGMSMLEAIQKYKGPKYVYLYDYRNEQSTLVSNDGKFLGVGHAEELKFFFLKENNEISKDEYAIGNEMITRWVNFAYSGNPNKPFAINTTVFGIWNPVTTPHIEFLRIKEPGSMEADYFEEKFAFWLKLPVFSKYG